MKRPLKLLFTVIIAFSMALLSSSTLWAQGTTGTSTTAAPRKATSKPRRTAKASTITVDEAKELRDALAAQQQQIQQLQQQLSQRESAFQQAQQQSQQQLQQAQSGRLGSGIKSCCFGVDQHSSKECGRPAD